MAYTTLDALGPVLNASPNASCNIIPIQGTNLGSVDPITLLNNNAIIAQNVSRGWSCQWDNLVYNASGDFVGAIWSVFASIGLLFGVATVAWNVLAIYRDLNSSDGARGIVNLFYALVCAVLLKDNAAGLAMLTRPYHEIVGGYSAQLLQQTANQLVIQQAFMQLTNRQASFTTVQQLLMPCANRPSRTERDICLYGAATQQPVPNQPPPAPVPLTAQTAAPNSPYAKVQALVANNQNSNFGTELLNYATSIAQGLSEGGPLGGFNAMLRGPDTISAFIKSQMDLAAYTNGLEIAMLLTALLGPLALGGSMGPEGFRVFFSWLSALFSIALLKICYLMTIGLTAAVITFAGGADSTWFASFISEEAPKIAQALAAGGGITVFGVGMTWGARKVEEARDAAVNTVRVIAALL